MFRRQKVVENNYQQQVVTVMVAKSCISLMPIVNKVDNFDCWQVWACQSITPKSVLSRMGIWALI